MMRVMLVAVFQTETHADSAAQALESHGVASPMIRRHHRVETDQTVLGVTVEQAEAEPMMAVLAQQSPIELENVGSAELDV